MLKDFEGIGYEYQVETNVDDEHCRKESTLAPQVTNSTDEWFWYV
jgi:hypothetical protein